MPVYNRAHTVKRALNSLLAQSYGHFEVIIVDDGSTDDSVSLIRPYLHDQRFRFIQLPENRGVNQARNSGFDQIAADTDWVTFLDSDDEFLPQALELMFQEITANPQQQDFCFSVIDQTGKCYSQMGRGGPNLNYLQQINHKTKARGEWVHTIAAALIRNRTMRFPVEVRNGFEGIAYLTLARSTGTRYSANVVRRYHTDGEGLTRINRKTSQKALDEIQGYQLFLEMFGADYRKFAAADFALFQSVLAKNYVECGQKAMALRCCWLAFMANPLELRIYRNLALLMLGRGRLPS